MEIPIKMLTEDFNTRLKNNKILLSEKAIPQFLRVCLKKQTDDFLEMTFNRSIKNGLRDVKRYVLKGKKSNGKELYLSV